MNANAWMEENAASTATRVPTATGIDSVLGVWGTARVEPKGALATSNEAH